MQFTLRLFVWSFSIEYTAKIKLDCSFSLPRMRSDAKFNLCSSGATVSVDCAFLLHMNAIEKHSQNQNGETTNVLSATESLRSASCLKCLVVLFTFSLESRFFSISKALIVVARFISFHFVSLTLRVEEENNF